MTPGNYILTQDVTNPSPDRRTRHDWTRSVTFKAGSRFEVRQFLDNPNFYEITSRDGRYGHYLLSNDVRFDAIAAHLAADPLTTAERLEAAGVDLATLVNRLVEYKRLNYETLETIGKDSDQ